MNSTIASRVIGLIAEQVGMDPAEITPKSTTEELKIDSLRMVDIIFSLEEEFDLTIQFNSNDPDGSNFKMNDVGDVITYMENLVKTEG